LKSVKDHHADAENELLANKVPRSIVASKFKPYQVQKTTLQKRKSKTLPAQPPNIQNIDIAGDLKQGNEILSEDFVRQKVKEQWLSNPKTAKRKNATLLDCQAFIRNFKQDKRLEVRMQVMHRREVAMHAKYNSNYEAPTPADIEGLFSVNIFN
jgi:hypothetical protein